MAALQSLTGYVALLMTLFSAGPSLAQGLPDQLLNGDMETAGEEEVPAHWMFAGSEAEVTLPASGAFQGDRAALLDSTGSDLGSDQLTANLMQTINAVPWRGKRVRLRAAVRTEALAAAAAAQLWFRVDRARDTDGNPQFGAFDNMQNRPIRESAWQTYDIVLQIDDDAERMVVGMFIIGSGKAWLDGVTLEPVSSDTPTTAMNLGAPTASNEENEDGADADAENLPVTRFQMPPVLMRAMAEADKAPRQPFYSHWLWLALIALILFGLSGVPPKTVELPDGQHNAVRKRVLGHLPKFAVRFSVAYWLLYSFPVPFSSITPYLGSAISRWSQSFYGWYQNRVADIVAWSGENVFKIQRELVPPNGSGDTTFNYIQVFVIFVLAMAIATLWSAIDWRKTDYRYVKDLLRSYLRYVLAVTMLGYGLAKVGWDSNQFPTIGTYQLSKTWGDSSPMNVLWSFMGASRPYTVFAGLGEVLGGLLLLSRRTTTLGACVVFGVMINIVMLNYCYDVPVKLYSTHLVCMAVFLLLPEAGRLANILVLNRSTQPVDFRPPYTNAKTIWIQRAVKAVLIIGGFVIPTWTHVNRQLDYFAEQSRLPEYFTSFDVVEYRMNGEVLTAEERPVVWQSVKIEKLAYNMQAARVSANWLSVGIQGGNAAATFTSAEDGTLIMDEHQNAALPRGRIELTKLEKDLYELKGETTAGPITVTLRVAGNNISRLTGRGYRWINEVPFNR